MADITPQQINDYLGRDVFVNDSSLGVIMLNLTELTGDPSAFSMNLAESIFKLIQAASETAASLEAGTDTYPAVVRTIQNVNGESKVRLSGTVNTLAPIDYSSVSSVS